MSAACEVEPATRNWEAKEMTSTTAVAAPPCGAPSRANSRAAVPGDSTSTPGDGASAAGVPHRGTGPHGSAASLGRGEHCADVAAHPPDRTSADGGPLAGGAEGHPCPRGERRRRPGRTGGCPAMPGLRGLRSVLQHCRRPRLLLGGSPGCRRRAHCWGRPASFDPPSSCPHTGHVDREAGDRPATPMWSPT